MRVLCSHGLGRCSFVHGRDAGDFNCGGFGLAEILRCADKAKPLARRQYGRRRLLLLPDSVSPGLFFGRQHGRRLASQVAKLDFVAGAGFFHPSAGGRVLLHGQELGQIRDALGQFIGLPLFLASEDFRGGAGLATGTSAAKSGRRVLVLRDPFLEWWESRLREGVGNGLE